ncbi:ATP-dependent DNA helicase [Georgenia sp.]
MSTSVLQGVQGYSFAWDIPGEPVLGAIAVMDSGKKVAVVGVGRGAYGGELAVLSTLAPGNAIELGTARETGGRVADVTNRQTPTDERKPAEGSAGIVLTEEFQRALELLGKGENVFLTGKAGTGKSTLIRHFMASTDRRVVVAAPTGIAALNVEGYTLHRLFGWAPTTTLDHVRSKGYSPGRFGKVLRRLDTLIVDEASMVRADAFDMIEAALSRFGPSPGTSFGGVQVVLVGDLAQLPPVVEESLGSFFATRYATPYFFSADAFSVQTFPTVYLTRVFRQIGDSRLTAILNSVREGVLRGEAERELASRVIPDFEPPEDEFWLTLTATNRIANARNKQRLERLPGVASTFTAIREGDVADSDMSVVEAVVQYKVGAQVMMLTNDAGGKWVNGTLGRISQIKAEPDGDSVEIEFRDGARAWVGPNTWEITRPADSGGRIVHEVVGRITQMPFKLAWAITVHKSQGQTLNRLLVDMTGGAFATGQVYVALSRCTSMEGLVLKRPLKPKELKTDRRVFRFLGEVTASKTDSGHCGVAILPIGAEFRTMARPRAVEVAVAFSDGTSISTLVNPEQDLYDAKEAYGIAVSDILLAPTLAEAWPTIAAVTDGYTPVGVDIERTLGLIEFELKRGGISTRLPFGVPVPPERMTPAERDAQASRSALERARAALGARDRLGLDDPDAVAFDTDAHAFGDPSLLLTRDVDAPAPALTHMTSLDALVQVGKEVSAVVLHGARAAEVDVSASVDADVKRLVAKSIERKVSDRLPIAAPLADRLVEIDALLGTDLAPVNEEAREARLGIADVLVTGARVCFSGERLDKAALRELAQARGLVPVEGVTKTRCEALIVGDAGTQSGKAKNAAKYGKPVFSLDEFQKWVQASA